MGPFAVGGIVFASLFGGAILGITLSAALPAHHLSSDSKDAIKLATAIVATLAALALGLLVASAKTSFDTADTQLRNSIARTVLLDRIMAHYGPETREARSASPIRGNIAPPGLGRVAESGASAGKLLVGQTNSAWRRI
jgi:hypothetical protein